MSKNVVISLSMEEEAVLHNFIFRASEDELPDNVNNALQKFCYGMKEACKDAYEEVLDGLVDLNTEDIVIVFEADYTDDEENDLIDALSYIRDTYPEQYTDEEKAVLGKVAAAFLEEAMGDLLKTLFEAIREKTAQNVVEEELNDYDSDLASGCDDPNCCCGKG